MKMKETNFSLLEAAHPDLCRMMRETPFPGCLTFERARDGAVTASVATGKDKFLLHSGYSPGEEAAEFVAQFPLSPDSLVVAVGCGLGYHLLDLARKAGAFSRCAVFEARPDVFRAALESVDLSPVLSDRRFSFCVSSDRQSLMRRIYALMRGRGAGERAVLMVHRPMLNLYKREPSEFTDIIEKIYVAPKMQDLLRANFRENLPFVLRSEGVKTLFGRFAGKPVILVSAGPSLRGALGPLSLVRGRAVVICVSTALALLMENGIRPDFVAIGDPKPVMITHFDGLLDCGIPLIFLPTACPEVIRRYAGPRIVAMQNKFRMSQLVESRLHKGRVDVGESVSTLMLDVALRSAADPIILVGQDLAFVDGFTHAEGIGKRLRISRSSRSVAGVGGGEVATSSVYYWILHWIERRLSLARGTRVINTSPAGASIRGTEWMPLADAIDRFCPLPAPKPENFSSPVTSRA